jgi:hypothetical protein
MISLRIPVQLVNGLGETKTVFAVAEVDKRPATTLFSPQVCVDRDNKLIGAKELPEDFWLNVRKYILKS